LKEKKEEIKEQGVELQAKLIQQIKQRADATKESLLSNEMNVPQKIY
jgi:hypothetical protein